MIKEKQSNTLYVIKAFAILSVIAAHMSFTEAYPVAEGIRNALGQIGVAIFFIVSGFFYKRTKGDAKVFWSKKLKSIVAPWILFSMLTYAFACVLKQSFSATQLIKWVLGIGTWYWFVPMLLITFALFKFAKSDVALWFAILISAASVMLTAFGFIKQTEWFSQYINVLNWIGFFALGILIRKKKLLDKLIGILPFLAGFITLGAAVYFSVKLNQNKAYVNYFSIITELSGALVLLNASALVEKSKLLQDIGKKSYFIYLIHMQPAGIINTRLPYNALFFVFRPFIVAAIVYLAAKLIELILKKAKLTKYDYLFALK